MEYVCDAPFGLTWFRLMTEAEAVRESADMRHAVEKHFRRERERAANSFRPRSTVFIEQEIGKEAHISRAMPLFLTLRDENGQAHVTAMLPPGGHEDPDFTCIIVGAANADPYPHYADAIAALARHFDIPLDRADCYPYRRG
jgi:hypothetical protein